MTIEHIFFDLDGTLVGSTGDVKPEVWAAIEPLRGRIGMSVCTGRARAGVAQRIAHKLDPDGFHIFENGAMVAAAHGAPAKIWTLDAAALAALVEASRVIDATVEFYTPDGVFVSRLSADCAAHGRALEIDPQEADLAKIAVEHEVYRAHWIMREPAVEAVRAVKHPTAEIGFASSPVLPEMIFASVTARGTDKGSAALDVAGRVGCSLVDCAAIGDSVGDLPVLDVVGHPFVVRNSPADLRGRFEQLGDVDEDGVLPLLNRLV